MNIVYNVYELFLKKGHITHCKLYEKKKSHGMMIEFINNEKFLPTIFSAIRQKIALFIF